LLQLVRVIDIEPSFLPELHFESIAPSIHPARASDGVSPFAWPLSNQDFGAEAIVVFFLIRVQKR